MRESQGFMLDLHRERVSSCRALSIAGRSSAERVGSDRATLWGSAEEAISWRPIVEGSSF